jgi:hypothetical protein
MNAEEVGCKNDETTDKDIKQWLPGMLPKGV